MTAEDSQFIPPGDRSTQRIEREDAKQRDPRRSGRRLITYNETDLAGKGPSFLPYDLQEAQTHSLRLQ